MKDQNNPWKAAVQNKSFIVSLIFVIATILVLVSFMPYFFHSVIGPRSGLTLNDWLLNAFKPRDNSWIIFGLIYLSLIITLHGVIMKPAMVLLGLKSYLTITALRMMTMYVFTLEAPPGIIPLKDPLIDVIAYGGSVFNKDLFFSGHVATLTLFILLEERSALKKTLMVNTLIVAALILLQRVHYTVDVLAAPIVTLGVVKLFQRFGSYRNSQDHAII